ncbi:enoyl-CoA hydratase/isomerase family protein [Nocardia sp. CA2R105]|uniref:enoyl-CoA hydratase/isomerase family protein n=1 Tax=Nocardia coffeae TaxID=2873381 RepID=UPI001CA6D495|nr:enoyl-CoA hydratase/isomerase family protein [Nocardia coffeae]MBY8862696.1 enoyl-CoA hydratase/isomerase family protein [Nocardia coffeae]
MPTLLESRSESVVTLTLNRPERLNAVSEELYQELIEALVAAEKALTIRCVVLTGGGRAFCAGADLKAHRSGLRPPEELTRYARLGQQACEQIQMMHTPVVAAVNGYALGAGAELAVSADFLIMAQDAQMGFPEVGLGTYVGGGVTNRLPRLVGLRRATDLLILGERFTGRQAREWGLAYAAVPGDQLLSAAHELADVLAAKAPLSLSRMKAALRRDDSLEVALAEEPRELLALMATRDWAEGVAAFAERRRPVFQGR